MVKHIILWTLKDEFNTEEIKLGIKENLEALKGKIPGLLEIEVVTSKLPSSTADLMLYSVFESEDSLKNYSKHPDHQHVANTFVRPFTQNRSCLDFEI